jgi:GT2 family glycosyltransferase
MDISVVIVSYRGYDRLESCLNSLKVFSGNQFAMEVIVVNNCAGDTVFNDMKLSYPGFIFIDNPVNGGYSNGCNLGASHASGDYILILNPDTVVTEEALAGLLNTLKSDSSLTLISCRQVNERGKESIAWGPFPEFSNLTGFMRSLFNTGYKRQVRHRDGYPGEIFFPDWVSGSLMLISKNDFQRYKGFDEDYWMYSEDVDLCKRISDDGGIVAYCTGITIEHNHGGSSRINKKISALTKSEVYISRHLYFSKHKTGMEKAAIQFFLVLNNLISAGLAGLAGLLFFFIPKLNLRFLVFKNLVVYYLNAMKKRSWKGPRSVNYNTL